MTSTTTKPSRSAARARRAVATVALAIAIYVRISDADRLPDGSLDELGIQRQIDACIAECDRRGATYVVYCENNRSASRYARKVRKVFNTVLAAVARGEHDLVLVSEISRFTREPRIVEDLIDAAEAGSPIRVAGVMGGEYDLNTSVGRSRLRSEVSFAAQYTDFISEKILATVDQRRASGDHWGGHRAFGYQGPHDEVINGRRHHVKAGLVLEPDEADAIRTAVTEVINGASLSAIARAWNAQGLRTTRKQALWSHSGVRAVLLNPRNAGRLATITGYTGAFVEYEDLGEAKWPAIIDRGTYGRLVAVLRDPNRKQRRPARRGLLTGLVHCERCDATLTSNGSKAGGGRFACNKSVTRPQACGSNNIPQAELESWIEDAVLTTLDSKAFWRKLDAKVRGETKHTTGEDPDVIQAELDELDKLIGVPGGYDVRSGASIRRTLSERLDRARAASNSAINTSVLEPFRGGDVTAVWEELSPHAKHAVIAWLAPRIVIAPRPESEKQKRGLWNSDRVDVDWSI